MKSLKVLIILLFCSPCYSQEEEKPSKGVAKPNTPVESRINLFYGDQKINPLRQNYSNQLYRMEWLTQTFAAKKRLSQGLIIGANASITKFPTDSLFVLGYPASKKQYNSLNFVVGYVGRYSFFDFTKYEKGKKGLMIDLGVKYNLPIFFHEVYHMVYNNRFIYKGIHNFLDFSPFVCITYKYVGITAAYSPVNYLIRGHTPNPPLLIGLSFNLPEN